MVTVYYTSNYLKIKYQKRIKYIKIKDFSKSCFLVFFKMILCILISENKFENHIIYVIL